MVDPTFAEQTHGVLVAMPGVVSAGLIVTGARHFAEMLFVGWWRRPPDGTIPGMIEEPRSGSRPALGGGLPEVAGLVTGLVGGVVFHFVLSFVVIQGDVLASQVAGVGIPAQELRYWVAATAVLLTLVVRNEVKNVIGRSDWYLGYRCC